MLVACRVLCLLCAYETSFSLTSAIERRRFLCVCSGMLSLPHAVFGKSLTCLSSPRVSLIHSSAVNFCSLISCVLTSASPFIYHVINAVTIFLQPPPIVPMTRTFILYVSRVRAIARYYTFNPCVSPPRRSRPSLSSTPSVFLLSLAVA